jgi:hypothetical protein
MDSSGRINTYLYRFSFVHTYILYIETPRPNTNRHVHAHKCLHGADIEPATPFVIGEYSHHYAKSAINIHRYMNFLSVWHCVFFFIYTYIHYHSRFNLKRVAEASQIFHRDAHVLPKRLGYEEHCRLDRW